MSDDRPGEEGDLRRPDRAVPPRTERVERDLATGDRELLHCLRCGRQLVAISHGGSCLFCGSAAVVVE